MGFNTINFIIFLYIFVIIYNKVGNNYKNLVLLFSSYIFYLYASLILLIILILLTIFSFIIGICIDKINNNKNKLFILSISIIIIILGYFKYYKSIQAVILNYFNYEISNDLSTSIQTIGLSFIIFQIISYLTDVYWGVRSAENSIIKYSIFLAFFPKLLQGPIVRADQFIPQIESPTNTTRENLYEGLYLLVLGLLYKIVIADRIQYFYLSPIYSDISTVSLPALMFAIYSYPIQIYFDFLGYSTSAIGIALLFNIRLINNFNSPLSAVSGSDFWRRWHISLSSWLRDYLFMPLQMILRNLGLVGSFIAIFITFVLAGIWHGPTIGFLLFGCFHGIWLGIEMILNKIGYDDYYRKKTKIQKIINVFITYSLISISFIFFRIDNLTDLRIILTKMLDSYKLILFDPIHGLVEIIKIIMSNQYGNVNLSSINNLIILISSFILVYIINIYQKNNFLLKISNFNKIIMIELLSLYVLFFGLLSGSSFIYIKF